VLAGIVLSETDYLRSGQTLAVTWDSLPPATEEFELLLRCEAPVAITLRLTESQDPGLANFFWRVPGIPCDRARLILRRGEGGRETTWAQSEPFRIEVAPSAPVPRVTFLSGEYWVEDGPAPDEWESKTEALWSHPSHRNDPCEGGVSHSGIFLIGDCGPIRFSPPGGKPQPRPAKFTDRDRLLAVQLRV
jgi:hypothetical protein